MTTTELGGNMRKFIQRSISKTAMVVFTMLFAQTAVANDIFYCTSEFATGIAKQNNGWRTADFELESFTIEFADDFSSVSNPEFRDRTMECQILSPEGTRSIQCLDNFQTFIFNEESMRFLHFYGSPTGYVENPDLRPNTNSLEAGICEKF